MRGITSSENPVARRSASARVGDPRADFRVRLVCMRGLDASATLHHDVHPGLDELPYAVGDERHPALPG